MTAALVLTALSLGVRHGIDWDHIAAITDLTSSSPTRRRGIVLSLVYALGHAAVVFALGAIALLFGASLPSGVDEWMGRVVGVTLLALGTWVLVQLVRQGRDFRLRSRWMLVLRGTFHGLRRVRSATTQRTIDVAHDHAHEHSDSDVDSDEHDHAHVAADDRALVLASGAAPGWFGRFTTHRHRHRHHVQLPSDPFASYGTRGAAGIGVLHGVGIESPTQIAVFVAATSVGGTAAGLTLLAAWVVGLVVANAAVAMLAGYGVLHAERSFTLYAAVAVLVAVGSIAMGLLLVVGVEALPDLLV
ncbi:MAG: hypothetical protein HKN44_08035 [Ilumatobacter sp.]|nr:hypothetical protein [Ilumatobacter sp.]